MTQPKRQKATKGYYVFGAFWFSLGALAFYVCWTVDRLTGERAVPTTLVGALALSIILAVLSDYEFGIGLDRRFRTMSFMDGLREGLPRIGLMFLFPFLGLAGVISLVDGDEPRWWSILCVCISALCAMLVAVRLWRRYRARKTP